MLEQRHLEYASLLLALLVGVATLILSARAVAAMRSVADGDLQVQISVANLPGHLAERLCRNQHDA